jgi:hypothetical protein
MIIKQFEAFNSKDISSISKFLKNMEGEDACTFIEDLKEIAEELDKPVSTFNGKYMSSKNALKIPGKDKSIRENYLKFWFSIEKGYLGKTVSRKDNPSTYSSILMNENGMLDYSQMITIKENFYNSGVLSLVSNNNYKDLKTGDRVVFIPAAGSNPVDSIVYVENDDEVVQIYLLQNRFRDSVSLENSKELLNKYKKSHTYRIYRKTIDEYNKEFKIGHISLLKYTKTKDEIHQDFSNIPNDIIDQVFFLNNNKECNNFLRTYNWTKERHQKFLNSDYSLVIDLENLDNISLSDIKKQRQDNSPEPINNDEYYKRVNINRWEDKIGRNIKSKITDEKIRKIKMNSDYNRYVNGYKGYDDVLINTLLDMYSNGQINSSQLDMILANRR